MKQAVVAGVAIVCILIPVATTFVISSSNDNIYYTATVHGNSMYPTFREGDNIIVESKNAPDFNISVGDVVVYWWGMMQIYVSHRVVDIKYIDGEPYYYTKGDNNAYVDAVVPLNEIEGKVICIT